jgi:hypothetical protein
MVIPARYLSAMGFSEGLALVSTDYLGGYIDTSGNVVIEEQFVGARDFSSGLAGAHTEQGAGFIDTTGAWVIEPQFADVGLFEGELGYVVLDDGSQAYIDRSGTIVWQQEGGQ